MLYTERTSVFFKNSYGCVFKAFSPTKKLRGCFKLLAKNCTSKLFFADLLSVRFGPCKTLQNLDAATQHLNMHISVTLTGTATTNRIDWISVTSIFLSKCCIKSSTTLPTFEQSFMVNEELFVMNRGLRYLLHRFCKVGIMVKFLNFAKVKFFANIFTRYLAGKVKILYTFLVTKRKIYLIFSAFHKFYE